MEAGLYIHIPFCIKKCSYCDFNSLPLGKERRGAGEYLRHLVKEMELKSKEVDGYEFTSVFVGGGTPTILSKEELRLLFNAIYENFNISSGAEVTIESNPKTLSVDKLRVIKDCKVNRLSIGLQAAQEKILNILGRVHSYDDFIENYNQAKLLGFDNINVDIMFSIPGQTLSDWRQTLEKVVKLSPQHISAYSLIVEEGTPICERIQCGELKELDEELDRKMYRECIDILKENGYKQYEISNFAKPGYESEHNIKYWRCAEYVGLGPGAHSYLSGVRYSNCSRLDSYFESIRGGRLPVESSERLTKKQQMEEMLFMGLRMNEGVSKADFHKRFGEMLDDVYGEKVEMLISKGLIEIKTNGEDESICLTLKGIDISNTVFMEFLLD